MIPKKRATLREIRVGDQRQESRNLRESNLNCTNEGKKVY